jgi:hypothetical protein
VRLS